MTDDTRERIEQALRDSIEQWWQTPPRLDFAADAVLAVFDTWRDEELARFVSEFGYPDDDIGTWIKRAHAWLLEAGRQRDRAEAAEAKLAALRELTELWLHRRDRVARGHLRRTGGLAIEECASDVRRILDGDAAVDHAKETGTE